MNSSDFIATAEALLDRGPGAPRQTDLRRAISTAYYAVFHCLARCCADTLIGRSRSARGDDPTWNQVYRALEHGQTAQRCRDLVRKQAMSSKILSFADDFLYLQDARHAADYNPAKRWNKADAAKEIANAKRAIESLNAASRDEQRMFAVHVLFRSRPRRSVVESRA